MRVAKILLLAALAPAPAFAHAMLEQATPAVGSTVAAAPTAIALVFSEGVETRFSRVVVTGPHGDRVDDGKLVAAGDKTQVSETIRAAGPGDYTVTWHVTSVDTHKTQGSFHFTVSP